jgi:hypothetical protein
MNPPLKAIMENSKCNGRQKLVRPKLQKRSVLKLDGGTIPEVKRSGIVRTLKLSPERSE